jgi:hypothetical protein
MRNGPVLHPLLALRATWVYLAVMAVVARPDNFTQALDTLNRQLRMGVFKMGWISKTTVQELDCVQAVLQLLHEPFIFVHAGPSLTFNIHLKCHTVQHAESRDPIQSLRAGAPLHQLYVQLSTKACAARQRVSSVTAWLAGSSSRYRAAHWHVCDHITTLKPAGTLLDYDLRDFVLSLRLQRAN